jgi:hypothetical protein
MREGKLKAKNFMDKDTSKIMAVNDNPVTDFKEKIFKI